MRGSPSRYSRVCREYNALGATAIELENEGAAAEEKEEETEEEKKEQKKKKE